ncbi:hypothetical protein ABPG75_007362 [Micractinium tetrahymenae]
MQDGRTAAPAASGMAAASVLCPLARMAFTLCNAMPGLGQAAVRAEGLSWPALLLALLSSSHALTCLWCALGWQLPLSLHVPLQAAHVALAARRVVPSAAVCGVGSALQASAGKLQQLALALDWPLRMVGGVAVVMSPGSACLAIVVWCQLTVGFLLPTAVLIALKDRRSSGSAAASSGGSDARSGAPVHTLRQRQLARPLSGIEVEHPSLASMLGEAGWSLTTLGLFAAQLAWMLLRVLLHEPAP